MKAKYYLRGMGIGIFVSALIFGIALLFYKPTLSEEEIRKEAAKLGMVNATEEEVAEATEDAAQQSVTEEVTTDVDDESTEGSDDARDTGSEEDTAANADEQVTTEVADESGTEDTDTTVGQTATESQSISIRYGEDSATVGAHLYKEGLVDNASKFNDYLEQNGYDNKIKTGDFTIPAGASYEEIAKIITRQ